MIIERTIEYRWEGRVLSIGMASAGNGPDVILLPALSSISTRAEMYPLLERLAVYDDARMPLCWRGDHDRG